MLNKIIARKFYKKDTVSPTDIPTLEIWKTSETYNTTDNRFVAYLFDGITRLYMSIQNGNKNHLPTDTLWWIEVSPDQIQTILTHQQNTDYKIVRGTAKVEITEENIVEIDGQVKVKSLSANKIVGVDENGFFTSFDAKAYWTAVLIGYTESYTPIGYVRAEKITGLNCENLTDIRLVNQSTLAEIIVRTGGVNVSFPLAVPQGTYKVKYTYSANKGDAMVSFEIEK